MDAPYLELLDGPDAGKQFPLVENEKISVGRLPDCSIILSDGSVSRLHSSVEMTNEKVEAADNESRNGTFVNEEKIQKKELRHEDILRCGDIRFRVILGQARWAKQVVEALQTTSDTTGPGTGKPVSTGEIRLLGWPYIIQTLSEHKCSARMVLAYRGQKGEVCFHQGKIFKASLLRFAPLQALLRMTSWDKALFILFQYLPVNKGQTNQELEGALDECLKQRDELQDILNSWAGPCPKFMTLHPKTVGTFKR